MHIYMSTLQHRSPIATVYLYSVFYTDIDELNWIYVKYHKFLAFCSHGKHHQLYIRLVGMLLHSGNAAELYIY